MTFLATCFSSTILFLVSLFTYVLVLLFDTSPVAQTNISSLSILPGISLSTTYLGDRIIEYQDDTPFIYLGVPKDTYSSFIYAK